ncbi:MAG: efflux RND transporter periplasmic adaptor subunit, partial [Nitrospinota bacterium]|nr:efflux RND transporter periplasmic adaptor subunit [Nitrospinota bacterium]
SSEEEYLLALKNAKLLKGSSHPDIREGAQRLAAASLERLKLFDVPAHQIEALEKDGRIIKNLHIHSPFDGIVISIGVRKGQYVTPAMELYTIANLSRIWVYVDIYEDEISWVSVGDTAKMTVTGVPGRQFTGTVSYIYPYLDAATRTNIVRLEFDNQDLALKPEMFAHVTLMTGKKVEAVVAPNEAIIRTGGQEQVFVVKGDGKFEPRKVTLGISTGKEVQILSGLQAGEMVVTSAQFLIDSESKLNEAAAKMMAPVSEETPSPTPAIDMNGMDMGGHDHMQMNADQKPATMDGMDMSGHDHMQMNADQKPAAMDGMDMSGHDHMNMSGHDHMKMEAAPEEKKQ